MIDAASIRRNHGIDGRLVETKLSDWVFNAIRGQEVLTLHPDYFRLGKPFGAADLRAGSQALRPAGLLIDLAGNPPQEIRLAKLDQTLRQHLKHIAENDHLPDYRLSFDEERDLVLFTNRDGKSVERPLPSDSETLPALPTEAYEDGRAAAPGYARLAAGCK